MLITLKYNASKERILKIQNELSNIKETGIDTKKYCGKIKLRKDAISIQREMRDEWE